MRKYSIQEIDELREACENKINFGRYSMANSTLTSWTVTQDSKKIEEMVRTLMLAGLTAKEIIDEETAIYGGAVKTYKEKWDNQSKLDGGSYSIDGRFVTKEFWDMYNGNRV